MKQERKIINIDVGSMSESEARCFLLDSTQSVVDSNGAIPEDLPDGKPTFYDRCKRFIRLYIFGKE